MSKFDFLEQFGSKSFLKHLSSDHANPEAS